MSEQGANLKAVDSEGKTALIVAINITAGTDVNAVDKTDLTL